jgi:glycosyltransferase involved in cell wall biosynthesis
VLEKRRIRYSSGFPPFGLDSTSFLAYLSPLASGVQNQRHGDSQLAQASTGERLRRGVERTAIAGTLRIAFLMDNMKFSGGRKLLVEYALFLRHLGHQVNIFARDLRGPLRELAQPSVVSDSAKHEIPQVDLVVASDLKAVQSALSIRAGKVIHFCQGFQAVELEQRLRDWKPPSRFRITELSQTWRLYQKRFAWKRRIRRLDRIYRSPTHLIVVSHHLKAILERRYGKPVQVCRNGVHRELFFPQRDVTMEPFSQRCPCRVICVGPYEVGTKGIPETIEAIRLAKSARLPVHFIRVSPQPLHPAEKSSGLVDEFHQNLSQQQLGEVFRSCNVYVSNSRAGEGFGLPAMEALSCGLICLLSEIPCYRGFANRTDFCVFVPQCAPPETATALDQLMSAPPSLRANLRRNGLEVAGEYGFERTCERFASVLERIASA